MYATVVKSVEELSNMQRQAINLIFPHQLFAESLLLSNGHTVYLIEEELFFKRYRFHKQKLTFHRASMQYYAQYLQRKGITVVYVASTHRLANIQFFMEEIKQYNIHTLHYLDPVDQRLSTKLERLASYCTLKAYSTPQFLNDSASLTSCFSKEKTFFFHTTFYKQQRIKHNLLLDAQQCPQGGRWTYDIENRKKYPKHKVPPQLPLLPTSAFWCEAKVYIQRHFPGNPGHIADKRMYPVTHTEALHWLDTFLVSRLYDFGPYEDAILRDTIMLHHSLLSPLLNSGLLLPSTVLDQLLSFAQVHYIPIHSLEGFVRQLIGWREFIRGMYLCKGNYLRKRNFWQFHRKLPPAFYTGDTGIEPLDRTIRRVLSTGYCHHIERLMVLGNFMLLCEVDPDEVYRWFMELFIDAYDWVMVPNVYGMSQFADGGTFATKPYISSSNYIKKMSNYPKNTWEPIWDGLFWRFIDKQQAYFKSNFRMSMLYSVYQRMSMIQRNQHITSAERFIRTLFINT